AVEERVFLVRLEVGQYYVVAVCLHLIDLEEVVALVPYREVFFSLWLEYPVAGFPRCEDEEKRIQRLKAIAAVCVGSVGGNRHVCSRLRSLTAALVKIIRTNIPSIVAHL